MLWVGLGGAALGGVELEELSQARPLAQSLVVLGNLLEKQLHMLQALKSIQ